MAVIGLLLVVFSNRIIFPHPKLALIESFMGTYYSVALPYPLPTDPLATIRWIFVAGAGILICLSGVWLLLKARQTQQGTIN